jgi:hypothetical protein
VGEKQSIDFFNIIIFGILSIEYSTAADNGVASKASGRVKDTT